MNRINALLRRGIYAAPILFFTAMTAAPAQTNESSTECCASTNAFAQGHNYYDHARSRRNNRRGRPNRTNIFGLLLTSTTKSPS